MLSLTHSGSPMRSQWTLAALLVASVSLSGCFGSDNNDRQRNTGPDTSTETDNTNGNETPTPADVEYSLSLINLTAGQPLSPPAVLLHSDSYRSFSIGQPASVALEHLAESGATQPLLDAVQGNPYVFSSQAAEAGIPPGMQATLTLTLAADNRSNAQLSLLSMMGNTNDAFIAVQGVDLSALDVNESLLLSVSAYDAGTEANTESAATVPGPAAGGEGFNAVRDDAVDQVTMHPGVVSSDDGLATSALTERQRWDNPAARIRITRSR